ncbi:hypothetical protein [Phaeobacter gallaeciensis]|uniref:hypothetical protein n=1 Tax=Phaeobacter gallaeciensis TaxID=60890 RepID=UPI00237F44FE|nr:hypothetical protein [Phaeobacter gallaeciensis]MDE4059779.1 hypothetical protein [Phaeobacter gallaeciensis]MDE4122584.1 hypothetical protein [Phaeobacter gallaeciensis]MDE4127267.1 hypothetical protein [Phaeobacter gallaeciensis]
MPIFVALDENWLVTRRIKGGPLSAFGIGALEVKPFNPDADPWAMPAGTIMLGQDVDKDRLHHGYRTAAGYLGLRPVLTGQAVTGATVTLPACPAGTVIEVHDLAGGEVMHSLTANADGFTDTITFEDAGQYAVEIDPPAPWLDMTLKVEV